MFRDFPYVWSGQGIMASKYAGYLQNGVLQMEEKTVVVLPGSQWQIPLIQKCKAHKLRTLVVAPYKNSPAFPYADGYLQSDIFDLERVVRYCQDEHADMIVSDECDIAVPVIAELGRKLSLPALTPECAHMFTNKFAMRNFCKAHGLPCPENQLCTTVAEAEAFFDQLRAPIIIKPLDSCSSRGVFTIYQKEDINHLFQKSLSFSKSEKAVLAERYIEGTEFTVDGIKTPGKHYSLAISEKRHFAHNPNVACTLYFSHKNENFDYTRLSEQNDMLVEQSPLDWGLTHAEYKFENGVFYLIEIGARGGGNLISSHIVPYLSGVDNYQYLLDCCMGNIMSPSFHISEQYKERCAVLQFFEAPEGGGIVDHINGLEFLERTPQIAMYQLNFSIGDRIADAATDSDRVGFYIACCESRQELDELIDKVRANIHIIYVGE